MRIANRVYVGEYAGICSVGRPRKRWIDTMEVCLKKIGLDVKQGRIGVNGRVCEGECIECSTRYELLILTRCHSVGLRQLSEALEGWKYVCGRVYNLKGIKGKIFCFSSLS